MPSIWTPEPKSVIPPGLRRPIFPGERGWSEACRLAGLVNGGMVNGGHALVDAGIIRTAVTASYPQRASVVAAWHLNEASGNATDSAGANTLTDNGTVGAGTGILSGCRTFNGSTQWLEIADNAALSMAGTDFSIQVWFKTGATGIQNLQAKFDYSTNDREYAIDVQQSNGHIIFNISHTGSDNSGNINATGFTLNAWHHVVCVYHDATPYSEVYIDGGNVSTLNPIPVGTVRNGTSPFQLGVVHTVQFFNGSLDEVVVWKAALSAANVTTLWNAGAGLAYS